MASDLNAYFFLLTFGESENSKKSVSRSSTRKTSESSLQSTGTLTERRSRRRRNLRKMTEDRHLREFFCIRNSSAGREVKDLEDEDASKDKRAPGGKNLNQHLAKHLMLCEYDPMLHESEDELWFDRNGESTPLSCILKKRRFK